MALVGFREIIILLILVLVVNIHKAMRFVHHMLLAASSISKHLAAEKAEITKLNSLSNIGQQSFE